MTLDQVFNLVQQAKVLTSHREFVVIGSNSVLGLSEHVDIPPEMALSVDLDSYLKNDPGRTGDLAKFIGEGSEFHREKGYYMDIVNPMLPTLPDGWQGRLLSIERGDCRVYFLDPDDAAISKYARGEPRDQRWTRAGLAAGLISLPKVQMRLSKTSFLDPAEEAVARQRVEEDARWLQSLRSASSNTSQDKTNLGEPCLPGIV